MMRSKLGDIEVGEGLPVRIMGVINMSPESFYPESVKKNPDDALKAAKNMVAEGAEIIDVGGMSTAPYKRTLVSEETELKRVIPVIKVIKRELDVVVSIDTQRGRVAEEAVSSGAEVVNDVSGLKSDPKISDVIRDYGVSAIVVARESKPAEGDPIRRVRIALRESISICEKKSIRLDRVVVDPGIGFFRHTRWKWYDWDCYILSNLRRLYVLGLPLLVAVSRKSFIGEILGIEQPKDRLIGSIAAEAIAVINGAHIIRTHNVAETVQAVRLAERIRGSRTIRRAESKKVVAEDLSEVARTPDDIEELLRGLGVETSAVRSLSRKGTFKLVYIRNVPRTLALVLKQELLSKGGDVAVPKETLLPTEGIVDVLLMATEAQIRKVTKKLKSMSFSSLAVRGLVDAPELADLVESIVIGNGTG